MKAVLLIGGEATRLRPLTCNVPKAMVPVLNRPFLEQVFRHLGRHGVKEIILTLGQTSQSIEGYFGDGARLGIRLRYTLEVTPLGTAGAVKNAEPFLDDTFLVLNGDVFSNLDITAMLDCHARNEAAATIALTPVADPSAYGLVLTDNTGRVTRFLEKPKNREEITTNMINAGTYVLEPAVLAQIPPATKSMFERDVFPGLLAQGQPVYAYPSDAYWIDIGTPEKYRQVNLDLLRGLTGNPRAADVLIGQGSHIEPSAAIKGPCVIGENCTVMEGAVIEQSVIWQGVSIGAGARVSQSVVAGGCHLGAGSVVAEVVLGDNVTVPAGVRVKPGSKVWPGTTVTAE